MKAAEIRKAELDERKAKLPESNTFTPYSQEWKDQDNERRRIADGTREDPHSMIPAVELFAVDQLEGKSPYEILGVSEGDQLEAHKAYRRWMRTLHPDVVQAEVDKLVEQIRGGSEAAWDRLKKNLEKISKPDSPRPEVLKDAQIAALSVEDQRLYSEKHESWQRKRDAEFNSRMKTAFDLRDELIAGAKTKAQLLNAAWNSIKKDLTYENVVGIASSWETNETESWSESLSPHQTIRLEGDAILRRELDFEVTDEGEVRLQKAMPVYLEYASGWDKELGLYEQYRESIPLKALFAFLELQEGRRVKPELLSDIAETYELTDFAVAQLQDLLAERADPVRIASELRVTPPFSVPQQRDPDAPALTDVVDAISDDGVFESKYFQRYIDAGYTPETLYAVQKFVLDERMRAREILNSRHNATLLEAARKVGRSFVDVKKELAEKDAENGSGIAKYSDRAHQEAEVRRAIDRIQLKSISFMEDIAEILYGPTYSLGEYQIPHYRAGVEMGRDGLRIILPKQDQGNKYDFAQHAEVFFNRNDIGIMREIAYGRSLGNNKPVPTIGRK